MHRHVVGIVLAGGRSERMGGRDKPLLPLAGKPLIAHVLDRLTSQVEAVAISANGDPARYAGFGLPVIADTVQDYQGPLAGLLAGMEWAAANTQARFLITAAGDTPFFPENLAARLVGSGGDQADGIVLAASGGRVHPVFGLWPLALRHDLAAHLASEGSRKITDWAGTHDFLVADFPVGRFMGETFDPFFNVNTPADLEAAEALHRDRLA